MDVKWSGATQDRAPSARECGLWRTCTDDNFEKERGGRNSEKKKEREEKRGRRRVGHNSLAAPQPGGAITLPRTWCWGSVGLAGSRVARSGKAEYKDSRK